MPILTPEERVGTDLAEKYRIERILGKGGMGVVFQGRHLWTEREVALKILFHDYAQDDGIARRFLQEARTAAQIEHPNVVDVLDMGRDSSGTVFLVLEMLEGESLADRLEREEVLEVEETLELLLPVMDALSMAHEAGIVHRDLKPDNIFISRNAKGKRIPKLLDFGIAKVVKGDSNLSTQTGAVIGTPQYMAPEQVRALPDVGPAADVWSMGIVLYEAMSGRLPFESDTPTAVLAEILTEKPPSVGAMNPELPGPLVMTIDRALIEDRSIRFPTMRAFTQALLDAADECGMAIQRPTVLPRPSDFPDRPRTTRAHSATVSERKKKTTPGPATRALQTPKPAGLVENPRATFDDPSEVTEPWSERPVAPSATGPSRKMVGAVLLAGVTLALAGGAALMLRDDSAPPEAAAPPVTTAIAAQPTRTEVEPVEEIVPSAPEPEEVEVEVAPAPEPEEAMVAVAIESAAEREARRRRRQERRERRAREAAESAAMATEMAAEMNEAMRGANDSLIIR
ncbi:MAG: serine/threonine-protein kinase [Myxococcota bacterium]